VVSPVENTGGWEPPELRPYREVLDVASGQLCHQRSTAANATVDLIRPDGYIAARGTPQQLASVLDYLQQLFNQEPSRVAAYDSLL
jgi:hypothetical protein